MRENKTVSKSKVRQQKQDDRELKCLPSAVLFLAYYIAR